MKQAHWKCWGYGIIPGRWLGTSEWDGDLRLPVCDPGKKIRCYCKERTGNEWFQKSPKRLRLQWRETEGWWLKSSTRQINPTSAVWSQQVKGPRASLREQPAWTESPQTGRDINQQVHNPSVETQESTTTQLLGYWLQRLRSGSSAGEDLKSYLPITSNGHKDDSNSYRWMKDRKRGLEREASNIDKKVRKLGKTINNVEEKVSKEVAILIRNKQMEMLEMETSANQIKTQRKASASGSSRRVRNERCG